MAGSKKGRLYIIGAGFAGEALAREIREKKIFGSVAAFLDDDTAKIGTKIAGIPVLGPVRDAAPLLRAGAGDGAIIAIPSLAREDLADIYLSLKKAGFARIEILPGISQIVEGEAHLIQTRSIDPQDLLGRTPVTVNLRQSLAWLRGKRVLVTGAGGSIGSELCRQLLSGGAERLFLLGHGENSIYQIDRELRLLQDEGVGEKSAVVPVIADLKDGRSVHDIVGKLRADVIFHTAAYKHVPLMEENPVAAIENNFFGTLNLLAAARAHQVRRFVLVTTDKAVDPVSVYGVSKYLCEEAVLRTAGGLPEDQSFMAVRFGNVLGSRGSILPLFREQIARGGPVTVTDETMKRWFMTIPEACSLILKAGGVGSSGTLYLLDMGEPVRIRDIAEQMIRFYGFEPGRDIKIEYIGVRPGERLDEPLWASGERPVKTEYRKILRIERERPLLNLDALTAALEPVVHYDPSAPEHYRDGKKLREILEAWIPSFAGADHGA